MDATSWSSSGSIGPSSWTTESILPWLIEHASTIGRGRSLDPYADLFAQGFDRYGVQTGKSVVILQFYSLSATYLRNRIVNALRKAPNTQIQVSVCVVPPNIVFENPNLHLLAARIVSLVDEHGASRSLDPKQERVAAINVMIEKYSVGLSRSLSSPVVNGAANGLFSYPTSSVVLLTGSTGGLGSFLLLKLLQDPRVQRVYAFNRPSSSTSIEKRQCSAFVDKGLSVDSLNSKKLVYVEADASLDNCGLSPKLYEEVLDSFPGAVIIMLIYI